MLNVDLALQKKILEVLNTSAISVISEEMPDTHHLIGSTQDYFLVDPLDGTTSCKRFFASVDTQVGFGPMVGVVKGGSLHAVAFFNAPAKKVYVAQKNCGAWVRELSSVQWRRLAPVLPATLEECGMLFYAGLKGELPAVEKIKRKDLVENMYRFGGFANDCSRIAEGFEQIQLQYTVKAWDIPATLLIAESGGHDVFIKTPSGWTPIYQRIIEMENPVVACPHKFSNALLTCIDS